MSREANRTRGRVSRLLVRACLTLAILAVLVSLTTWLAFPWHRVGDVRVENASLESPGLLDRAGRTTSHSLVVQFTTHDNLTKLRSKIDIGYISAKLFACKDPAKSNEEVVTQRAEYRSDRKRVKQLDQIVFEGEERQRYRVTFDNELTNFIDHQARFQPAIGVPGGLCFALDGGSMWAGKLWSNKVPVTFTNG